MLLKRNNLFNFYFNCSHLSITSITVHQRAVLDLERELHELRCKETILKDIQEKYNANLVKLGDREPPVGVDLLDAATPNYERVILTPKCLSLLYSMYILIGWKL